VAPVAGGGGGEKKKKRTNGLNRQRRRRRRRRVYSQLKLHVKILTLCSRSVRAEINMLKTAQQTIAGRANKCGDKKMM